jgi:hypothetical protein
VPGGSADTDPGATSRDGPTLIGQTGDIVVAGGGVGCIVTSPANCAAQGGTYEGADTVCGMPGICGVPCELAAVEPTSPPDCAIDARQPSEPDGTSPCGWDSLTFHFAHPCPLGVAEYSVRQVPEGPPPIAIAGIAQVAPDSISVSFDRRISKQRWTCVTYGGQEICIGSLPGDVNADGVSSPVDILAVIDNLNERVVPPYPPWQCDVNCSNLCEPADILRVVDLLNGAGVYKVHNGQMMPPCP